MTDTKIEPVVEKKIEPVTETKTEPVAETKTEPVAETKIEVIETKPEVVETILEPVIGEPKQEETKADEDDEFQTVGRSKNGKNKKR